MGSRFRLPACLLFVVDIDELGVDYVVFSAVFLALIAARLAAIGGGLLPGLRGGGFIHRFGQLMAGSGQPVGRRVDAVRIVLVDRLFGLGERVFDFLGLGLAHLAAMLLERLFDVVDHGIGLVLGLDGVALLAVIGRVGLSILGHLLDFVLGQARGRGDGDLLLVVGALVLSGH